MSNYAEDTVISTDGSRNSIQDAVRVLKTSSAIFSLNIHLTKSQLLPLGPLYDNRPGHFSRLSFDSSDISLLPTSESVSLTITMTSFILTTCRNFLESNIYLMFGLLETSHQLARFWLLRRLPCLSSCTSLWSCLYHLLTSFMNWKIFFTNLYDQRNLIK